MQKRFQLGTETLIFATAFVSKVRTALVSLAGEGVSLVVVAVVLAAVTSVLLLLGAALACRRKGTSRYEVVSVLSPGRYLAQHGLLPARGWTADPASDIPAQLFPKHVQGLHASGNMAFVKDFEAFRQYDPDYSRAEEFQDAAGPADGGPGEGPISVESWHRPAAFLCLASPAPLSDRAVWRTVWDSQVELIVTMVSGSARDDLALFSSSKFIGSFQLQLESEQETQDFISRTLKVRNRGTTRTVTQLVFPSWPETGPPARAAVVSLARESARLRQRSPGPALVYSGCGASAAVYLMSLDTVLTQLEAAGDTNLSHYSRVLAVRHRLQLASAELYIHLHDTLAWAIQHPSRNNNP